MIRLVYLTKTDQLGLLIFCVCRVLVVLRSVSVGARVLWTGRPATTNTARDVKQLFAERILLHGTYC